MTPRPGRSPAADPVLVVGFPKAGTTALAALLTQHPGVSGGLEKEDWSLYPSIWERRPAQDDEVTAFLEHLDRDDRRRGLDAAPWNVLLDPGSVDRLLERAPDLHVLATVRDHDARIRSNHRFAKQIGFFRGSDLDTFVTANLDGHEHGAWFRPGHSDGAHLSIGLYGARLEHWADRCGPRLAIVHADALRGEAALDAMARIHDWLGLDPHVVTPGEWNVTQDADRSAGTEPDRLSPETEGRLGALLAADRPRFEECLDRAGLTIGRPEGVYG